MFTPNQERHTMNETTYVIRSVNTGRMVEAHDTFSMDLAQSMVNLHNKLYPGNQWVLVTESI